MTHQEVLKKLRSELWFKGLSEAQCLLEYFGEIEPEDLVDYKLDSLSDETLATVLKWVEEEYENEQTREGL